MDTTAERQVRLEGVERVLKMSQERIKIAMIIPKLLEHPEKLKSVLMDTCYEEVLEPIDDMIRHLGKQSGRSKLPHDHTTMRIVDFFLVNHSIHRFFPHLKKNLLERDRQLLAAFHFLLESAHVHLHRSSRSEITKERKLHAIYHQNVDIKKKIKELKASLAFQKVIGKWKTAAKGIYLMKVEEDLANKKWQNNVAIQNEIEKCHRTMRNYHKSSMDRQKELEEELQNARESYEKMTKKHLAEEHELRNEKNKLLLQLQSMLKKYDTSLGEKMRENLVAEDQYLAAKKVLDDFMVQYRQEERIYKNIVVKREEEERRVQQEKLVIFMMNRAAGKIQKYWRKWKKDQRKRKRQGKGKGKKGK
ncbi:dynein regulatory complex protein 10 [Drosophila sechellia]|uniref:Dynein regulatory complex protein 10 n=1 Tax=Drosophila sechellia TaxID=7238 RepID=B4HP75_DROSE|nr:dynein regulatory complex protein 10 [Drosophila sechellia]EDW47524.1 GM21349 [Drosophila sechellia]